LLADPPSNETIDVFYIKMLKKSENTGLISMKIQIKIKKVKILQSVLTKKK